MKTMQAFFSQFETLVEDLPSSIDKLVSMLHQALDAYHAAIQDHGLDSYPAQFWLTVFRMISVETGETGPAEDLLRELIATHAELATAEVSYLHDLADLFFELYKRDINNDDLFQQYLNIPIEIGHRGKSGFTDGFRYISALAFETVRTVYESQILEQGRGTFLTSAVISPSPLKLG